MSNPEDPVLGPNDPATAYHDLLAREAALETLDGRVTTLEGTVPAALADKLAIAANLSDVADPDVARDNLNAQEAGTSVAVNTVLWNVKDHGAIGDGVTDDVAAIQATIDAAAAAGGGTVFFPEGTYKLTASTTAGGQTWHLSIVKDNVWLDCAPGARLVSTVNAAALFITGQGKPAGVATYYSYDMLAATYKQLNSAAAGAMSVTTTTAGDAATFAAGDFVYIRTGQLLAARTTEPDAEINQVVSVNAGTGVVKLRWPLAKPYAQEYFVSGTTGLTSTSVTANLAVFGIAKVSDRVISNIKVRNIDFDLSGGQPAIIGGNIVDYEITGCKGAVTDSGLMSQGLYRRAKIENNAVHSRGAGTWVAAVTTATGTSDVTIKNNRFTGERVVFAHIHEGSANVDLIGNLFGSTPSASDEDAVSIRARAYNIKVKDNTIINAGSWTPIYVDPTCTGGGEIVGNRIRGLNFTQPFVIEAVTGWQVGPNDTAFAAPAEVWAVELSPAQAPNSGAASSLIAAEPAMPYNSSREFAAPVLNTTVTYKVWLSAGTWRLDFSYAKYSDSGIATLALSGGIAIGTVDAYNAGLVWAQLASFTGIVVPASGVYDLTMTMASKNGSSSGYQIRWAPISLVRTA